MTGFDTKISEGNAGLLRSRDMYQLMERLDFITQFLFFQGNPSHPPSFPGPSSTPGENWTNFHSHVSSIERRRKPSASSRAQVD